MMQYDYEQYDYEAARHLCRGKMLLYFPRREGPTLRERAFLRTMLNNLMAAYGRGQLGNPPHFDPRTFAWESLKGVRWTTILRFRQWWPRPEEGEGSLAPAPKALPGRSEKAT